MVRAKGDLRNDRRCGFHIIKAREIDTIGIKGVIEALKARVGDSKVYISVDIDSLDPAFAPGMSRVMLQTRRSNYFDSDWNLGTWRLVNSRNVDHY